MKSNLVEEEDAKTVTLALIKTDQKFLDGSVEVKMETCIGYTENVDKNKLNVPDIVTEVTNLINDVVDSNNNVPEIQCLDEVSDTCTSESNPGIDLSNILQDDILKFGEANSMSNDISEKYDIRIDAEEEIQGEVEGRDEQRETEISATAALRGDPPRPRRQKIETWNAES
ncbi:unnamed protein product [Mytilus edulis]|uniref:Uncharacterized protein n=1 Tax=Mytilus edulis TaxID=6550 RepID=A0A8S3U8J7_MYTED|nr:unnamed protein product [Mytilus edulis]